MFNNKSILITGGTGSFGRHFTKYLLDNYNPRRVIIFSRDEFKQYEMQRHFEFSNKIRFFIGDIRDKDRLMRAFYDVDYIVHAAALKQVVVSEYNPFEAIKTNILGAQNVIEASIDSKVSKVIALSTDKAANPLNLYGATKLCSDKLFVAGNAYAAGRSSTFSVVRYGNVLGSRGSVLPLFIDQKKKGIVTITHPDMTRFWITLDEAVKLVVSSFSTMAGGEIYVPKIPSISMGEFVDIICPEVDIDIIGIRPGEKLHEMMISSDDARHTLEFKDHYKIMPEFLSSKPLDIDEGKKLPDNFYYSSDNNPLKLDKLYLKKLVKDYEESLADANK